MRCTDRAYTVQVLKAWSDACNEFGELFLVLSEFYSTVDDRQREAAALLTMDDLIDVL